jgi:hypothetical protein
VAYGFAWGPSPVAGITPFAQMQTSLNRTMPKKVRVGDRIAKRLAKAAGVSKTAAEQGFAQLPTPLAVAGVPASLLNRKQTRPYLPKAATVAGSLPAGLAPTATDIVAGGNLGVTYSTGDITQGAIGTVTSVCNGLVRGFGHPFNLLGKTSYAMTGADTLYIQEDPAGPPFTMANFGTPLGTVNQDRIIGVSGMLGAVPTGANVTSVVTYGASSRTSTSNVSVKEALALTTNLSLAVNHLAVLGSFPPGAEVQTWKITGKDGTTPFTLNGGNRYADTYDVTGMSQWDLPDLAWALSLVPGVTVDSITSTATVTDDPSPYRLVGVEQRAHGEWIKLNKTTPAHVKAGSRLRLRLLLANDAGSTTTPLSFGIPKKAAGQRGKLFLDQAFPFPFEQGEMPSTLAGVSKMLRKMVRNDQIQAQLGFFSEFGAIERSKKTAPADRVITGSKRVKVIVD